MMLAQGPQRPRKLFIQMSGAPGSGKSTIARLLRQTIGGVVIDHDVLRSSLLEDSDDPFDQVAKCAYNLQWSLAEDFMKQGLSVIVDSCCNFEEVLDQGSALAEQQGFTYWYIECQVDDIGLLDERLRKRDPLRSQRTAVDCPPSAASSAREGEDSKELFKKWIESPCRPERNAIMLDSRNSARINLVHILRQIQWVSGQYQGHVAGY